MLNSNYGIKITFIISNLGQGGAERQFIELIKRIDKKKFNVNVFLYAVNKGVFYTEIEEIEGIILTKHTLKYKNKIFKIFEALICINKYLKNNNFEVVFTTLFMNGLFVRLISPKKYKFRIVATIRNSIKLYSRTHLFVEKVLIRYSYLVANSKNAAESFKSICKQQYQNQISYIYNGFDELRFVPKYQKARRNSIVIGNVGRMTYQKNQIQLLKIISVQENKDLKLIIVGSESDQTELLKNFIQSNCVSERVELIEKVNNIENYYSQFDLFILSSFYEGCPNVLFEALLSKCLCIISEQANTDNFIENGINGYVYDGTDIDLKLKLEFVKSIMNTHQEQIIIENGYKYAKENFSMNSMVEKYEQLFIKIYEENKSRH